MGLPTHLKIFNLEMFLSKGRTGKTWNRVKEDPGYIMSTDSKPNTVATVTALCFFTVTLQDHAVSDTPDVRLNKLAKPPSIYT